MQPVAMLAVIVAMMAALVTRGEAPAATKSPVAGAYENLSFHVEGGVAGMGAGSSALMPWLYLLDDFTYVWGQERGTYKVQGNQVRLSGSYRAWGPGTVDSKRRMTFHFTSRGKRMIVVMSYHGLIAKYPPPGHRAEAGAPGGVVDVKGKVVFTEATTFPEIGYPQLVFAVPGEAGIKPVYVNRNGLFTTRLRTGIVYALSFQYLGGANTQPVLVGTVDMGRVKADPYNLVITCHKISIHPNKFQCRG